jgi:hypothetical protein
MELRERSMMVSESIPYGCLSGLRTFLLDKHAGTKILKAAGGMLQPALFA